MTFGFRPSLVSVKLISGQVLSEIILYNIYTVVRYRVDLSFVDIKDGSSADPNGHHAATVSAHGLNVSCT